MINYGTNEYQTIGGRAVCNVANWCARINEFEEKLDQLIKDRASMVATIQTARKLGTDDDTLRPVINALWHCDKSISYYEKELRIDKSYISN